MKKTGIFFIFLLVICVALFAIPVTAIPPTGGENYVTFTCNVDSAEVYLDGTFVGTISGGSLDVPDGAFHTAYRVTRRPGTMMRRDA